MQCLNVTGALRPLRRSERGSVTVITAIIMFMALVCAGALLDYARLMTSKTKLSAALDASILAASYSTDLTDTKIAATAKNLLKRNFSDSGFGELQDLSIQVTTSSITMKATAVMPAAFSGFFGKPSLKFSAEAQTLRGGRNIEVALILDNTGSMAGTRMEALKSAATNFVDIVVQDKQTPFYSKVAIIPYSMGVNIGTYAATVLGSFKSATCTSPGCTKYKFTNPYGQSITHASSTCVSERQGSYAYNDVSYDKAKIGYNYPSAANPCLSSILLPLTSDKSALKTSISTLAASGSTAGQVGVAWGWYTLSPNFGLWSGNSVPAAYDGKKTLKIALLMTDGEYNSSYCNGVISSDSTYGSGDTADHINCKAGNGNAYSQAVKLCSAMKDAGITVFTIGFDLVDSEDARNMMTSCASSNANVFMAANEGQLKSAFTAIAKQVSGLRLSK